jgi:predicted outer membrane repeat protein
LGFEQLEDRWVPALVSFTVNTADDTPMAMVVQDPMTLQDIPVDANGNTSLRAVVDYANLNPETGNPSLNNYLVDLASVGTITLDPNLSTLVLESNFRFNGGSTTVQRSVSAGAFRLFDVDEGMSVYFYSMTLQGGAGGNGGAIRVNDSAKVQVDNCTLMNNTSDGSGGAIYAGSNTEIWINMSVLGLNTAVVEGGAIATAGAASLSIYMSSILGNEVTGTGASEGFGGGLLIRNTLSTLIEDTFIFGNETTKSGGGLYYLDDDLTVCSLTMDRGEIDDNEAGGHGGGFYIDADGETVTLTDVAVTDNHADGKGGGGYVYRGTLAGSLDELTGNTATTAIPGIAYKAQAPVPTITVPMGQQTIVQDP